VTHLHLGVRAAQRTGYPGKGEWRWMAGWIKLCPSDLGWLQPSGAIAAQSVPRDGFDGPAGGIFEKWWTDLLLLGAVLLGSLWWIVVAIRKGSPLWLLTIAAGPTAAARYLTTRGVVLIAPVFVAAAVSLLVGFAIDPSGGGENRCAWAVDLEAASEIAAAGL
jgi:hypothetical protein